MVRAATRQAPLVDDLAFNIQAFEHHLEAEGKSANAIRSYREATDALHAFLREQSARTQAAGLRRRPAHCLPCGTQAQGERILPRRRS